MENQDIKLFQQFKKASQNEETKKVPNSDAIWNSIEQKLDHQVLKKENKTWKKWTVAASILLVGSIAFQLLKKDSLEQTDMKKIEQSILKETIENNTEKDEIKPAAISTAKDKTHPITNKNNTTDSKTKATSNIVNNQMSDKKIIENQKPAEIINDEIKMDNAIHADMGKTNFNAKNVASSNATSSYSKDIKYEIVETSKQKISAAPVSKEAPLIVKDGILVNSFDENDSELETLYLSNPLYIINGTRYSENELYGEHPTSPYYPLKKQKIESCTIITPEKAIKIYGKNGENGVVIITTKNGIPLEKN